MEVYHITLVYFLLTDDGRKSEIKWEYNVENCVDILERHNFMYTKISLSCTETD